MKPVSFQILKMKYLTEHPHLKQIQKEFDIKIIMAEREGNKLSGTLDD